MQAHLLAVLLTTAGAAVGQDDCYGGYGGYGSYGTYGTYGECKCCGQRPMQCGQQFGQCGQQQFGPFNQRPGGIWPFNTSQAPVDDGARKDLIALDKKLRDLERRLEEQDEFAKIQQKLMEKQAEAQEKLVAIVQNYQIRINPSNPSNPPDNGVSEQLKALTALVKEMNERQQDKQTAAAMAALLLRIESLEGPLKGSANIPIELKKMFEDGLASLKGMNAVSQGQGGFGKQMAVPPDQGLIVVRLPGDAKLFLNEFPSAVGAEIRSFLSPKLEPGKNYFYTLRVEMERNGKIMTASRQVYFQPGREVQVHFDYLEPALQTNIPQSK